MRNICGVCASHLSARGPRCCATRPSVRRRLQRVRQPLGQQAADRVVLAGRDQRLDLLGVHAGSAPRRAPAPSRAGRRRRWPQRDAGRCARWPRGSRRRPAAGARPRPESAAAQLRRRGPRATPPARTPAKHPRHAAASSVWRTIGRPARRRYCLGVRAAGAAAGTGAQGIRTKRREGDMRSGIGADGKRAAHSRIRPSHPSPARRGAFCIRHVAPWTSPPHRRQAFHAAAPTASADALLLAQLANAQEAGGARHGHLHRRRQRCAAARSTSSPSSRPSCACALFPDWETLPYDTFSPHQDLISERLATLWRIQPEATPTWCWCPPPPPSSAWRRRPSWPATPSTSRPSRSSQERSCLKAQLTLAGYST